MTCRMPPADSGAGMAHRTNAASRGGSRRAGGRRGHYKGMGQALATYGG